MGLKVHCNLLLLMKILQWNPSNVDIIKPPLCVWNIEASVFGGFQYNIGRHCNVYSCC